MRRGEDQRRRCEGHRASSSEQADETEGYLEVSGEPKGTAIRLTGTWSDHKSNEIRSESNPLENNDISWNIYRVMERLNLHHLKKLMADSGDSNFRPFF